MRVPVPLAALAGFLAWASTAHAASFDCAKAAQPAERLICADSALSALDEAMAAEYSRARAAVSENGRKQFRDMTARIPLRGRIYYVPFATTVALSLLAWGIGKLL